MLDILTADTFAGVTVVDLTRLLPGPFATMLLADLGARVIKVEPPLEGDYARWTPPIVVPGPAGYGAFFESLNRGKLSVALDLKRAEGRALVHRLLASADVLIESFRPGVMERLGLGDAALKRINGRLIVCRLSSYGQSGPLAQRAGHDLNFLARSGALSLGGPPGGPPAIPAIQIGDLAGGALYAAFAVASGLYRRERTALGCTIDVSMTEGVLSLLGPALTSFSAAGEAPRPGAGTLSGGLPCYRVYGTGDGGSLAIGALEPKFWAQVCTALGLPELISEGLRAGADGDAVAAQIQERVATQPLSHWRDVFSALDACAEPVCTLADVVSDAHFAARGALRPADGGRLQAVPPTSLGIAGVESRAVPLLGAHTDLIAAECGFTEEEIESARAAGAIAGVRGAR